MNFPLYMAYKHSVHSSLDELSQQEASALNNYCELSVSRSLLKIHVNLGHIVVWSLSPNVVKNVCPVGSKSWVIPRLGHTWEQVVVVSGTAFSINGMHNGKLSLCLYNAMGWDVMSRTYNMAFQYAVLKKWSFELLLQAGTNAILFKN